jgi:hypothetical protein
LDASPKRDIAAMRLGVWWCASFPGAYAPGYKNTGATRLSRLPVENSLLEARLKSFIFHSAAKKVLALLREVEKKFIVLLSK